MKITISVPANEGDVWTREAADSVVGSIFKYQDHDVLAEKVEFDEDHPKMLKVSFTYVSDRELEVMLVQGISLSEERIKHELPDIDIMQAKDLSGRYIMLDAYAALASFRASMIWKMRLDHEQSQSRASKVFEPEETAQSDSPNRPTTNKL